ncbi:MAG: M23 family metallopeptidase [Brevinematia bacterium]
MEYLSRKEEASASGKLGEFYKQEMLENLRYNSGTNCWETSIDGRTIIIGRKNIDNDFDPSSNKNTNYTLEQSREHVHLSLSNMQDKTIEGFAKFARQYYENINLNTYGDFVITSLWRTSTADAPHNLGRSIDMVYANGTPVYAAESGNVTFAGMGTSLNGYGGYGNIVVIQGDDGMKYYYAHNTSVSVQANANVTSGSLISYSGNSGGSILHPYAYHLHFEVR